MIRRILFAIVVAAFCDAAAAQSVMDGSDKAIPPKEMETLTKALRSTLVDPFSGQLIDLKRVEAGICGKINSKNRAGGYGGFRQFAADFKTGDLIIALPDMDLPDNPESLPTPQLKKIQAAIGKRLTALKAIQSICDKQ
jgi:hypothetical protein